MYCIVAPTVETINTQAHDRANGPEGRRDESTSAFGSAPSVKVVRSRAVSVSLLNHVEYQTCLKSTTLTCRIRDRGSYDVFED